MFSPGSFFASKESRRPVLLLYDIYGMLIVVSLGCLVLGVSAAQLADDLAGGYRTHLGLQVCTLATQVALVIAVGFRIRIILHQLLRATEHQAHTVDAESARSRV